MPSTISEDPRIGATIREYQLEKRLASGGMGTIFLAQRAPGSASERSILRVFKLLRPELAEDSQGVHLFKREVQILQRLHHPNIVQLEDHGIHETLGRYICMEYITGHTLKTHLRHSAAPPDHRQLLRWMEQIGDALSYCHEQQIVHRDLKPENIFLQAPNSPAEALKLFDFGIASCPDIPEIPARHVGTPRYMPPEQIRNEPVDGRADLYALGVILFELLTHRPLFVETDSERLREAHLHQTPPTVSEKRPDLVIPERIDQLFAHVLAKDPSARPANIQAFVAQLKAVLPDEPFPRHEGKRGFVVGSPAHQMTFGDDVETPSPEEAAALLPPEEDDLLPTSSWKSYLLPLAFLVLALVGLLFVLGR